MRLEVEEKNGSSGISVNRELSPLTRKLEGIFLGFYPSIALGRFLGALFGALKGEA